MQVAPNRLLDAVAYSAYQFADPWLAQGWRPEEPGEGNRKKGKGVGIEPSPFLNVPTPVTEEGEE